MKKTVKTAEDKMSFNFEQSLERLKTIVDDMESSESSLEESLKLYSEGIKLYKKCSDFLEKSGRKVELLKNGKEIAEDPKKEPETELFGDVD